MCMYMYIVLKIKLKKIHTDQSFENKQSLINAFTYYDVFTVFRFSLQIRHALNLFLTIEIFDTYFKIQIHSKYTI